MKVREFHLSVFFRKERDPARVINAGLAQTDDLNVLGSDHNRMALSCTLLDLGKLFFYPFYVVIYCLI